MSEPRLPAMGRIYKLRNLNQWVKIIQVETQNEENIWYAEVWLSEHAGWWSAQHWIPVEDLMLDKMRDR